MKKNNIRNQKWYNNAVSILIGVIGYVFLTNLGTINGMFKNIRGYFAAILIGAVIAYLVNPLATMLQKSLFKKIPNEGLKWMLSVFMGMAIVILALLALLLMLVPQLIESIMLLVSNMDGYIRTLNALIENINIGGFDLGSEMNSLMTSSEDLIKTASQLLSTSLKQIVSTSAGIGKNVINVMLAAILSIYLLLAKESIKKGSKRLMRALMSQAWYEIVRNFLNRCNNILVRYIVFSLLDGVIVGGATAIFMAITGMEYIGLISVVCGVTNLIPSFGPIIGGAIGGFILLLVNPWHALLFILFTGILQTLDGYVIKPKLFGDSLGVSGLLILIAIVLLGNIFGIVGILLAIPMAAIFDFTYEEGLLPLLEARRARLDAEEAAEEPEMDDTTKTAMHILAEASEGGKHGLID